MSNFLTKALNRIRHGGAGGSGGGFMAAFFGGGRRGTNYRREVGDLLDASVVMAPVQWMQRSLPEAKLCVKRTNKKGESEELRDHPMLALIQKPNPYYADIVLFWGVVLSLLLDGNAYLLIVRNGYGKPAELWYVPHWMIEPRWEAGGDSFIDHYRYAPGGGTAPQEIEPEDVVHFRYGINPRNLRKGISPIDSAIREIFMDNESSKFVSALLKNMGVPGVVISPKGGAMATPDDAEATKAWFTEQFSGDNRGKPLVMGAATEVSQYGFNPQQMNMSEARDVAEERVCALIGIPAAVVGFGAGLQSTKVGATMEEMRKLAWHNGVLPLASLIADELQRSLLPLFGRAEGLSVEWDTENVKALQEDEDKKGDRWNRRLATGGITLFDYRVGIGLEADDSHRIYLRPINLIEVPESQMQPPPAVAPLAAVPPAPKGRSSKADRATAADYKRGAAFVLMLQGQERGLLKAAEKQLQDFFVALGVATGLATWDSEKEAKADDAGIVQQILEKLGIDAWQSRFAAIYAAHYQAVATATSEAASAAGLGASMPDEVARSVIAAGGRRAAMVDLNEQTKAAIFDALAEGRAAGEGADALAKRIVGMVEGGPWGTAETRARVIARTETKYAQNISTVERARAAGVTKFVVFDGRLGPGRSKPDHIARDGSIVSDSQAEAMAEAEHPNGTLSFAPHFGD